MAYMDHVMEMGSPQKWETLPLGCLFRWIGGVSLFKKVSEDTAIVCNRPTQKLYPSWWELTVLVYTP